jgi:16S rRNA (uracil1498-N3)-methyltransferase
MATHRIMLREGPEAREGQTLRIDGPEAKHARVRRLAPGDRVEILNGWGCVAMATVVGFPGALEVRVEEVRRVERLSPRVEVASATPKGGRLDELIGGLSQVGVGSWRGLRTNRGVAEVRGSKSARIEKLAEEASKQCGRAWVMEVGKELSIEEAVAGEVVVADAEGQAYEASGGREIRLLVGPEGGWTEDEMRLMREAGARVCSFGAHVMRIEVAAVVAAGIVIDAERRAQS